MFKKVIVEKLSKPLKALSWPLKALSCPLKAQMFLNYMSRENIYFEEKLARSHS
jgi:hypothetical protein